MASKEQLLREYVRGVLSEDDGGGDGGDFGGGGMGMYGMSFGTQKDMYNVFIRPFTDVVQTAMGKTKEMSLQTLNVLKTTFETVATTLIPWMASDYKEIFKKHEERMDKVREQYTEVYDANWTALKDLDVAMSAFLYAPAAFVTQMAVRKAPIPVMNTIDALTGGIFSDYFDKIAKRLDLGEERTPLERTGGAGADKSLTWSMKGGGGMGMGGGGGGYGGYGGDGGMGEGLIREKKAKKSKEKKEEKKLDVAAAIMQPKIMQAIENSPIVKQMEKQSRAMVRQALEEIFDKANGVMKAQSLDQMQKAMGKQIPAIQKLAEVPEEQRAQGEAQVLKTVKASAKKLYVQGLTDHIKLAVKSGVPQDHPYIADYVAAINKIKSL